MKGSRQCNQLLSYHGEIITSDFFTIMNKITSLKFGSYAVIKVLLWGPMEGCSTLIGLNTIQISTYGKGNSPLLEEHTNGRIWSGSRVDANEAAVILLLTSQGQAYLMETMLALVGMKHFQGNFYFFQV